MDGSVNLRTVNWLSSLFSKLKFTVCFIPTENCVSSIILLLFGDLAFRCDPVNGLCK